MRRNPFPMILSLLVAFAMAGDGLAQKKRLYRWVDENGNVFYSDQVPPDEVDRARDEFSERGTRTGQVERALTAEERAAQEAEAARAAEALRAEQEAERKNRNLLIAYPTEDDLKRSQEQRILMIDSGITASRASLSSQERSLASLLSHAADAERAGQPVPAPIASQIAEIRAQVEEQMAQIADLEAEREQALRENEEELARYRTVREEQEASRR